ncbi:hypothetical protein V9T40_009440 [Parthenolecanium corni]|uniref:Suppressor of G2 allele of SKP1 n=1 Tax=Parthenolecanium corni TaxID=536013 RepID=A0AAN9Y860_9HEMI
MESCSSASVSPKYDWYQTDAKVVITILVKKVVPESVNVNFTKENVSTSIKLSSNEDCDMNFCLSHPIVPEKCTFKVTPSKIEIHLAKVASIKWNMLEKKVEVAKPIAGPKNWDALAKNLVSDKDEETIDTMFNKIYADGSDEQKRAMLKSFYESGGTVLSTDWKEVSKKKVDIKPPEGVEFKPWTS